MEKKESKEEKYVGKKKREKQKEKYYMKEELEKKAKLGEPIIH